MPIAKDDDSRNASSVEAAAAHRKRGALRKKSCSKRAPSEQPIISCPKLTSHTGMADHSVPDPVRTMVKTIIMLYTSLAC